MSDDLATLLRDASNEPTMTPDAGAIHAAGQRRTVVRRTATGLGALAMLGVVAIGVSSLTERTVIPPIDTAPPTEAPAEDAAPGVGLPTITAAALAEASGGTVTVLHFDTSGDRGRFDRTDVTPDGEATSSSLDVLVTLSDPLVTDDGTAWVLDGDNRTVAQRAGAPLEVRATTDGPSGWRPIGLADDDQVLVIEISTGGVPVAVPPVVRVLGVEPGALTPVPGVETDSVVDPDGYIAEASLVGEQLVLLHGPAGDGASVDVLTAGTAEARTVHDAQSEPSAVGPMAVVGAEVWLAEQAYATDGDFELTGPVDVLIGSVAGSQPMLRLATPLGRSMAGTISGIDVSPDGGTVVLSVRADDGEQQPAIIVDVEAARAAARAGTDLRAGPTQDAVVGAGVFSRLDVPGIAAIGRWAGPAPVEIPSTCATEGVDRIDARPVEGEPSVWFDCSGGSAVAADMGHGFWRVRVAAAGASPAAPADQTTAAIQRWAAGPSQDEQELGLRGGIGPDITLSGVSFEGSRVLVDLTPAPGAEGAWSTSSQSMQQMTGFAGAALQLPEFDELLFTTGGRCEDFTLMTEVEPCFVYTEVAAPWAASAPGELSAATDGRHAARISNVEVEGRALEIDLVQWLTGAEANAAFAQDVPEDGSAAPNDYWVRDRDRYGLLLNVAEEAVVRFGRTPDGEAGAWEELPARLAERPDGAVFWVEIRDGRITSIEEQWVP